MTRVNKGKAHDLVADPKLSSGHSLSLAALLDRLPLIAAFVLHRCEDVSRPAHVGHVGILGQKIE